jgi:acetyltransferase-like isoleucine patch superfamily enzyme
MERATSGDSFQADGLDLESPTGAVSDRPPADGPSDSALFKQVELSAEHEFKVRFDCSQIVYYLKCLVRVSALRTLYYSARFRGWCIVLRGTRMHLSRRSRIHLAPGSRLVLGTHHAGPSPSSVSLDKGARLYVQGKVDLARGARLLLGPGARLEIGSGTYLNPYTTITCLNRITIGSKCAISWNTNILDGNGHNLVVEGMPKPRLESVSIGDNVWIGTGVIVLGGVRISDGAVVAAGAVVCSDVPERTLVGGNPARIIREAVAWEL